MINDCLKKYPTLEFQGESVTYTPIFSKVNVFLKNTMVGPVCMKSREFVAQRRRCRRGCPARR